MRALMDRVHFETRSGDGASVILEKRLRFLPNSPLKALLPADAPPVKALSPGATAPGTTAPGPPAPVPGITDPQAEPTA
jgi:hypothetical protein